ncbi:FrgA protein [Myxococcus sp. K38C18041901]|uniref:GspE/PulE/PilB domain-containing protein n=1 Tax=Myxococcus guangdongensis TaxID=2906760 RepID=UPI0020A76AB8|nr:FrgA protein [Myxococcus guangdongensis]MCP3058465.1 FrgA protein [Myxococcus guangdongensis]
MPARLAQLLVSRTLLSQEKAGELLRLQQAQGGHLDTLLLEQGLTSEADVLSLLGDVAGFRPVNLVDFEPNLEVASFIPPKIAERLCVVPLSLDGQTLHVACAYPVPKKELDEVGFLLGKPLELWVAAEVRIREWISTIYRQPLAPRFTQLVSALDPDKQLPVTPPPPPPSDESLTVDMVERLARSVAGEPVAGEIRAAPREAPAVREPQRPPPPPPPDPVPPPAFVRAPLRLNMPSAERPATPPSRPDTSRPAQPPVLTATPPRPPVEAAPTTVQRGVAPSGVQAPARAAGASPTGAQASAGPSTGAVRTQSSAGSSTSGASAGVSGASGASPAGFAGQPPAHLATGGASPAGFAGQPLATGGASPAGIAGQSPAHPTTGGASPAGFAGQPPAHPTTGGASPTGFAGQPPAHPSTTSGASSGRPATGPGAQPPATTASGVPAATSTGRPATGPGAQPQTTAQSGATSVARPSTSPGAQPASQPATAARPTTTPASGAPASATTPGAAPALWPPAPSGGAPQLWPPGPAAPTSGMDSAPLSTMRFGSPLSAGGPRPEVPPAQPPRSSEPAFIVFPNPNKPAAQPRAKTPEPEVRPPPTASANQDVPDWTLAAARAALRESTKDRDKLMDVALRFGRRTFDYVAAFAVLRGAAIGWEARGDGMASEGLTQVSVPLDASSVFRTVAVTRGSYAGPLPPDALTRHYLELFGRQTPRTVFLYPVEVKGRLVAIIYGDCGQKPMSQRRLSDYILFCQDLASAFQELILFRKQRVSEPRSIEEDITIDVDVPVAATPAPAPAVVAGLGWSPFFGRGAAGTVGRAAALPPRAQSQEERPPPDFAPLLRRLTGPDAAQRSNAMVELARSPEASARVLAQHFPGPTAWSRLPVVELPEADELGPIPAALSRLGRPAAQALAPLLDSHDADTRYFALLTAGNLPYVELVDGVLRGLFDLEPDISSAARVAAAALKQLPRLDSAMRELRQELNNRDMMRRALAARALGTLHDREAVEGLIQLTRSEDEMCAQAAAEALREVTRMPLGLSPKQWAAWWAENRSRRRADWLIAALRHRELDVRLAAIEELSRALNDTLGYYADAPENEREVAARRWESAAVDPANARRLGML